MAVGRLGRPHGIRGEVTVEVRTDEPESRFAPGSLLYSAAEPKRKPLEVETARWQGKTLVVRIVGYPDRSAVEKLRGTELESEVAADELPDEEDAYYDRQLIGLKVRLGGEVVGEVSDVLHLPGQEVLVVRREGQEEALLPFVSEFVPEVNLEQGFMAATPPPGLFDEVED